MTHGVLPSDRVSRREGYVVSPSVVVHRWNMPEGQEPPPVGAIIAGKREHWEVREVIPVESAKYPNAFRARLRRKGPHGLTPEAIERLVRLDGWWTYVRG